MALEARAVVVIGSDIGSVDQRSGKQESRGEREGSMVLDLISLDLPCTDSHKDRFLSVLFYSLSKTK